MEYTWDISAVYDFNIDIVAKYQIQFVSKPTSSQIIGPELAIIDGCTLGLCTFSIFLICRALWKSFTIFTYAKRQLSAHNVERHALSSDRITWSKLSLGDKAAFFNLWLFMTMAADLNLVVGCGLGLYRIKASKSRIPNQNGATSGFEMCFAPSTLGAGSQRSQPKHVLDYPDSVIKKCDPI